MRTPQTVKDAAAFLTDEFPTKLYHIGEYDGYEVFGIRYLEEPEPCVGFPSVFLYKEGKKVITETGSSVFEIIQTARNNKKKEKTISK